MNNDTLEQFLHNIRFMLDNLPGLFFVKDLSSHYVGASQNCEKALGLKINTLIGKSDYEFPWAKCASNYRQNDVTALNQKKSDVLEPIPLGSGLVLATRCVRVPVCDNEGKVLGLLGQVNVFSSNDSFNKALQTLSQIDGAYGLHETTYTQYHLTEYQNKFHFTARETECLFLMLRGKTAKEIGTFLEISKRTVEQYIENIKNKMGVSTRSEVIATAIEAGLLDVIPKNEVFANLCKNSQKWQNFLDPI